MKDLEKYEEFLMNAYKDKLSLCSAKYDRNFLILIVLLLVFLFLDNSIIREIEFSGIKLNDINYLFILIPPLFGFFFFQVLILTEEIDKLVKEIMGSSPNSNLIKEDENEELRLQMLITPINFIHEFSNLVLTKKLGLIILAFILYIPILLILAFLPLIFLIYTLYRLYISTFPERVFVWISIILTTWILIAIVLIFIRNYLKK